MGFLANDDVYIEAILTERGKELLLNDPTNFKFIKAAFFDDEIDYTLSESSITATLIPEPISRENNLLYMLQTLPKTSTNVSYIEVNQEIINIVGNGEAIVQTITQFGTDRGFRAYVTSDNITLSALDSTTAINESVNYLSSISATNASTTSLNYQIIYYAKKFKIIGKSIIGTYYIYIQGIDTGSVKIIRLTVTSE